MMPIRRRIATVMNAYASVNSMTILIKITKNETSASIMFMLLPVG